MVERKIPNKLFFKIGEVCELTDIQPYVLRYWETEFPTLAPAKNSSGQRIYRRRDIETVIHPYTNLARHREVGPLILNEGRGIHLYDDTGKRYIEGMAGLWCASLGFSEKRLGEAAKRQMDVLPYYHSFSGKAHNVVAEVSEKLIAQTEAVGA